MEIIWYGLEQASGLMRGGTISFLAIVVLMVLIGIIRIFINRR